jgi:hypothetical protein
MLIDLLPSAELVSFRKVSSLTLIVVDCSLLTMISRDSFHIPRSVNDVKKLKEMCDAYMESHFGAVLLAYAVIYIL